MHLPDQIAPVGPHREHRLRFHDTSQRVVFCTDTEVPFPDGQLIVSRTDLQGLITHANEAFVRMSGYAAVELIGAPHHILRHPDMPQAAFADLWLTVSSGHRWRGYVKNLRKDGAFYWVYATAVPNMRNGVITGYTSVRRKPSRAKVAELSAAYERMLAKQGAAP